MTNPDFAAARMHALTRLERELAPEMHYHSLAHTRDEVLPATERLAQHAGVSQEELLLLRTAAAFHDVGFILRYDDHEEASADIARRALPAFGYREPQIDAVVRLILATRMPHRVETICEKILADADLSVLAGEDFPARSEDLRRELAAFGNPVDESVWIRIQCDFLEGHHYLSSTARTLYGPGKTRNLEQLRRRLAAQPDAGGSPRPP